MGTDSTGQAGLAAVQQSTSNVHSSLWAWGGSGLRFGDRAKTCTASLLASVGGTGVCAFIRLVRSESAVISMYAPNHFDIMLHLQMLGLIELFPDLPLFPSIFI